MGKFRDLTNIKFGEWTALEYLGNMKWKCECSCGNIKEVSTYSLTSGISKSCRHAVRDGQEVEVGKRIWNWDVLEKVDYATFKCKCLCGKIGIVNISSLRYGYSKSCGCKQGKYRNETMIERYKETDTNRIYNPRKLWCVEALNDTDKFRNVITNIHNHIGRKPSIKELVNILGVNKSSISKSLHKHKLDGLISFYTFISSGEREVREHVEDTYKCDIEYNKNSIITPYELDIYIPKLKLAIEFNGDYWHSTIYKDKIYHQNKTIACAKKGIQLIHVFEYEWNDINKREIIKGIINNKIKPNHRTEINASKLSILELNNEEACEFYRQAHYSYIINTDGAINISLSDGNNILGVMTIEKQQDNDTNWEITKLVYKRDILVIDGPMKMLKYFIEKYNPSRIIAYCDVSKYTGDVYKELGFNTSLTSLSSSEYVWKHSYKDIILNKQQTKTIISLSTPIDSKGLTEDEIMEQRGFLKIYDSGKLKFTWKKSI